MKQKLYVGIDPGKSGCIVVLAQDMEPILIQSMPISPIEFEEVLLGLCDHQVFCVIEQVGGRPGQGGKAMFSFGFICGMAEACLYFMKIPIDKVLPVKWQKAVGVPKIAKESYVDHKRRLKSIASMAFPKQKVTLQNADAFLLAKYCYLKFNQLEVCLPTHTDASNVTKTK
jgi:hypothetical protein